MLKIISIFIALFCLSQNSLRAEVVNYMGETFNNCEKDYLWIKQKVLGHGPYGYIHTACSKKDPTNCEFAAKVQSLAPGFHREGAETTQRNEFARESAILKKLENKNIAPNLYESFVCKIKTNRTGKTRDVGVIIMDKYDQTLYDFLNAEFDKFAINNFGSQAKAQSYFVNSLKETNPTNPAVNQLVKLKNGLVRANEALEIGRFRNLQPNRAKFLKMPLSAQDEKLLSEVDDLLVKLADNKIIHRDMKVDNIMVKKVGDELKPIIIDYNLAYEVGQESDIIEGNLNGYWDETFQVNAPGTHEKTTVDPRDYCYDRVLLEIELYDKYGISHKFKSVNEDCRKYIYDTYLQALSKEIPEELK